MDQTPRLKVELVLPAEGVRRWHADLIARLRNDGRGLRVLTDTSHPQVHPAGVAILQALEEVLYGIPARRPAAPLPGPEVERLRLHDFEGEADLIVDLTGGRPRAGPTLVPLYDSHLGEHAAVSSLLDQRVPAIAIVKNDRIVAQGVPAVDRPEAVSRALHCVLARTASLIVHAIATIEAGQAQEGPAPHESVKVRGKSPASFGARSLAAKVARLLTRLARGAEGWHVAWRFVRDDPIDTTLRWPHGRYRVLADDGARYFADPFIFEHGGEFFVFCEEFPYGTGKGIISCFTITRGGIATAPRPVLDAPYHLSYPTVFACGDKTYMIPESAAAGAIELWRAERFPDLWVKDAVLIDGVSACDATLTRNDGRLWMFAAQASDGGTSWDSLVLFHADNLWGPWHPHPLNPVLLDAAAARPAGWTRDVAGGIRRFAQDCSRTYGGGLSVCHVDRLDPEGFSQRVEARLSPPPGARFSGAHTINRRRNLEVIDVFSDARSKHLVLH